MAQEITILVNSALKTYREVSFSDSNGLMFRNEATGLDTPETLRVAHQTLKSKDVDRHLIQAAVVTEDANEDSHLDAVHVVISKDRDGCTLQEITDQWSAIKAIVDNELSTILNGFYPDGAIGPQS